MTKENLEMVRKAYEDTNQRNFAYLEDIVDENVEIQLPSEFPGTQVAHGRQGFRDVLAELEEAFRDIRYEPQEFFDEKDRVLAAVRFTGHARYTGLPVDMLVYWLYAFRDGKMVSMDVFLNRERALKAAGLSE